MSKRLFASLGGGLMMVAACSLGACGDESLDDLGVAGGEGPGGGAPVEPAAGGAPQGAGGAVGPTGGGMNGGQAGSTGLGGQASKDVKPAPEASAQLTSVPGPVDGVAVTKITPAQGIDAGGFYVQAELKGPALFVAVEAETACGGCGMKVGDIVSFSADALQEADNEARRVTAVSDFEIRDRGYDVSELVQDVTNVDDLVSGFYDYASELVSVEAKVVGDRFSAGSGFEAFQIETSGISGDPNLELRLPEALLEELSIYAECSISLFETPARRFESRVQLHAWSVDDIQVDCPPVPALLINEVQANATLGCDLMELRATRAVSTEGLKVTQRGDLVMALPPLQLKANDFIVLHRDSDNCNASGSSSEASKDGQSESSHAQNYDSAYDLYSADMGLTNTDNVFSIEDGDGAIIDALFATDAASGTTAGVTESAAAQVAAAGQWTNVDGSVPGSGYQDETFNQNAAVGLKASSSTLGLVLTREDNLDRNHKGDWDTSNSTWGRNNPGQVDFQK